jgi:predicted TIM-barrel fold metal-dependent hydrolase
MLPMLKWQPEKRASALEMLNHPWLKMEDNYEYQLTEKEYKTMMMKKEVKQSLNLQDDCVSEGYDNVSELAESEYEMHQADIENNLEMLSDFSSEDNYK